jgi:hypothetical protein
MNGPQVDRLNARGGANLDNASMAGSRPFGSISMIKEIIVHLRHLVARDPSREFGNQHCRAFCCAWRRQCCRDLTGVNAGMAHGV